MDCLRANLEANRVGGEVIVRSRGIVRVERDVLFEPLSEFIAVGTGSSLLERADILSHPRHEEDLGDGGCGFGHLLHDEGKANLRGGDDRRVRSET